MTPAVIIIDLQKYFYKLATLKFENKINPNIEKLLKFARESKIKIIHIKTIYKKDKSNWPEAYKSRDEMWCMENNGRFQPRLQFVLGFGLYRFPVRRL